MKSATNKFPWHKYKLQTSFQGTRSHWNSASRIESLSERRKKEGRRRYRSVQQVVARRTGRNYGAENDKWRSTTKFYSTHIPEENSISLYIDAWISSRYRSLCIDTRVFVRSFVCLFTYLFIYLRDRSSRCNKLKHRHQSRLLVSLSSSSFFLPAGNLFNDDACARWSLILSNENSRTEHQVFAFL